MTDAGDKLNITCPELKALRAALRTTRSWLSRVKKCGASNGQAEIPANVVTDLINEHDSFLVTAVDAFKELKQVGCGYCVCRQPYHGFMIACDSCEEWYHGPCVGVTQEQAEKFDKYVCVRCSTLRVFKDNASAVAGILIKWTSAKGLAKARSGDSQRYGRKVRSAERDILKAKTDKDKYEQELKTIRGSASDASRPPSQSTANRKIGKSEIALRDKIGKAHSTIVNCEKRMEGYRAELVERKTIEAREAASASNLKRWCAMVKQEVFSPVTREKAELSRPHNDGSTSAPMDKAKTYAEKLGIVKLPDVDAVLNSFKIFSWCLHTLGKLMSKPRVEEIRSLLAHSDTYFKLPEAKCVRMLRSMSSRAQIWQSKTKKALMPIPNEETPFELAHLRELLAQAKQIPLTMPEEARLLSTIEDGGNRHCICGGPSDGSFMLGCDNCDRWFHGSCVNIDKATGDALSKWICPPCSKLVPDEAIKAQQTFEITGDTSLPAEEIINQQLIQPLTQPHDISPHAPDPMTLWPPFGLRSSKEAVEALGEVGDSDNEDFTRPVQLITREKLKPKAIQPINREKPKPKVYPQDRKVSSASTLNVPSNLHFPLTNTSVNTGPPTHPQHIPQQVTAIAPRALQTPAHQTQPIARANTGPPTHPHCRPQVATIATRAVQTPTHQTQPIARVNTGPPVHPQRRPQIATTAPRTLQGPMYQTRPIASVNTGPPAHLQRRPQVATTAPHAVHTHTYQNQSIASVNPGPPVHPQHRPQVAKTATRAVQTPRYQTQPIASAKTGPPANLQTLQRVATNAPRAIHHTKNQIQPISLVNKALPAHAQMNSRATTAAIHPKPIASVSRGPPANLQATTALRAVHTRKHQTQPISSVNKGLPAHAPKNTQATTAAIHAQPIASASTAPPANLQTLPRIATTAPRAVNPPEHHTQPTMSKGLPTHPQNAPRVATTVKRASEAPSHQTQTIQGRNYLKSHTMAAKTNHQPKHTAQRPFSNVPSSTTPHTSSTAVHHTINYQSVANMDHYVLPAETDSGLRPVSVAPVSTATMGSTASLPTNVPTKSASTACPQVTPKTP